MRMTRRGCYFVAILVFPVLCHAAVTRLPDGYREALQKVSRFKELRAITNLPRSVVALCADENGKLAAPAGKWQAGDVITDNRLPRKRLIWAATDGEWYVVHYERGGRARSFHVLVTLVAGETKPKVVWRGVGNQLKNYREFLAALKNGDLDDTLDYVH